ncbi:hypothetical protein DPMN_133755 [Dreissena polymorpha]|uniref:Uncharacterized protein n=1 Tax=Dreissena polymorpha TaxID=45954 RepID=A0A9D4FVY8_DREPO|nr:hypothetical protein DPMN_133755 [Dreissena polymorpha]
MATVSHEAYLTEESEIADVSRLLGCHDLQAFAMIALGDKVWLRQASKKYHYTYDDPCRNGFYGDYTRV